MDVLSNAALEGGAVTRAERAGRTLSRVASVDVARGVAVVAMAIYHGAWDLSEVRLIATEVIVEPGWRAFARMVASSFLTLVGIGLVLGHPDGIRWRAFGRRLLTVAGAALVVTIATMVAFPDSFIFFGILHAIALASVLALPLIGRPAPLAALAAALVFAAPLVLVQPIFDAPILAFLGLGTRIPNTNDWVPVFPWAGFVFAGVAAAKLAQPMLARLGSAHPMPAPARALAWLGRHSLVIYLLHQPLLFGAAYGLVALAGPNPEAVTAPFRRSCAASCRETGAPEAICRQTCDCTVAGLKAAPVWPSVQKGRLRPDEQMQVGDIARACFRQAQP